MRKTLLIIACAICALTASAQRARTSSTSFFSSEKSDAGVTFGIRAGMNISSMSFSNSNDVSYTPGSRTSFHVGVIADIPLMQSLYVQTGLFLQDKGFKDEEDGYTETAKPMFLEIPILASYRHDFSDAVQLQVNFGPYIGYGLGGKLTEEAEDYDEKYEEDFFGDEDDDSYGVKRLNFGMQVGAGITFSSHYYLGFAYQFGLANMGRGDVELKDKNWMISLGYNF